MVKIGVTSIIIRGQSTAIREKGKWFSIYYYTQLKCGKQGGRGGERAKGVLSISLNSSLKVEALRPYDHSTLSLSFFEVFIDSN